MNKCDANSVTKWISSQNRHKWLPVAILAPSVMLGNVIDDNIRTSELKKGIIVRSNVMNKS
jgi:hypothetical protein